MKTSRRNTPLIPAVLCLLIETHISAPRRSVRLLDFRVIVSRNVLTSELLPPAKLSGAHSAAGFYSLPAVESDKLVILRQRRAAVRTSPENKEERTALLDATAFFN